LEHQHLAGSAFASKMLVFLKFRANAEDDYIGQSGD